MIHHSEDPNPSTNYNIEYAWWNTTKKKARMCAIRKEVEAILRAVVVVVDVKDSARFDIGDVNAEDCET